MNNSPASQHLTEEEIASLYRDWVISAEARGKVSSHYLLYWDRIYFNNYLPYLAYPLVFPRSLSHSGSRYSIQIFESFPGEWEKGLEQSSRISLSFRSYLDEKGKQRGIVLVKAALYKEII